MGYKGTVNKVIHPCLLMDPLSFIKHCILYWEAPLSNFLLRHKLLSFPLVTSSLSYNVFSLFLGHFIEKQIIIQIPVSPIFRLMDLSPPL